MRSCQLRQISICQFSSRTWSFEEDLARYEAFGFDSIGVWRKKIDDRGTDEAIDLLYKSKLSVASLHHTGGFTGDGSTLKQSILDTFEAIRLAAKIDAGVLLIHPGAINNHLASHLTNVYQKALDQIIPFAESLDVQLAIEPILDQPNSQFTFHRTIADTIDLLSANPSLGVALDLYHVGMAPEALDRLEEYASQIQLVQLADRTANSWDNQRLRENRRQSFRLPLGEGEIDVNTWIRKLNKLGYRGPFELEVFGTEVENRCSFDLLDQTSAYLARTKSGQIMDDNGQKLAGTTEVAPSKKFTAN